MEQKPEPCPFCGGKGDLSWYRSSGANTERSGYFIQCEECSTAGPPVEIQGKAFERAQLAKVKAIAAWNTRPATRRDALEEAAQVALVQEVQATCQTDYGFLPDDLASRIDRALADKENNDG